MAKKFILNNGTFEDGIAYYQNARFKYLHQLQNLHFALVENELEIQSL